MKNLGGDYTLQTLCVEQTCIWNYIAHIITHTTALYNNNNKKSAVVGLSVNTYVQIVNTATRRGSVRQNMPTVHVMWGEEDGMNETVWFSSFYIPQLSECFCDGCVRSGGIPLLRAKDVNFWYTAFVFRLV